MLEVKPRVEEIVLEFQDYIPRPPVSEQELYARSTSNDTVTINSWRNTWINQAKENHKTFGSFSKYSLGKLWGKSQYMPAIVAGSGPSLSYNGLHLKERGGLGLVSCLHNYHYFVDNDIPVDLFVTLDAGPVTIEEVSEGGKHDAEFYWNSTKDKKLAAYIGTHPELLKKWQGEIFFFNCPIPDETVEKEIDALEKFHLYVSTGGNVLGAAFYIARGILGANPICFVGADFSFSYKNKFHGWDSKYDQNLGRYMKAVDVYGNQVKTWQSYHNFKCWFDTVAQRLPGLFINCTEGGTFGAYPEGNIMSVKQMKLTEFINMYHLHSHIEEQCKDPQLDEKKILI